MHKRQLISCYSCNFGDLISYLVWEGKGTEEWGEKEKVARYRNPLLFISIPDWLSHNEWPLTCIKWETTVMQVSKEICSTSVSFWSKDHKICQSSIYYGHYLLLVHIEGTQLPETSFLKWETTMMQVSKEIWFRYVNS